MKSNCDNGSILAVKLTAFVFTFLIALAGSLFSVLRGRRTAFLRIANIFASGEFIGVAMLHLQWEGNIVLRKELLSQYPIAPSLFIVSLLMTMFLHRGIALSPHNQATPNSINPFEPSLLCSRLSHEFVASRLARDTPLGSLFTVILSVHSFFGGFVIGLQMTLHGAIINFIAFGVHKGVAGYALGLDLASSEFTVRGRIAQCLVFSSSTPIGIALGIGIMRAASGATGHIVSACCGALSAGSFLYIAVNEIQQELGKKETIGSVKLHLIVVGIAALIGVAVMAIIFPVVLFPGADTREIVCV